MSLLACHHLAIEVPGRSLVTELDWDIGPGQFWLVLGRNGSGKTSLLQSLAGLRPIQQGELHLHDQPLKQYRRIEIAQRMAILFQQPESGFPVTVLESAMAGRHPHRNFWGWPEQDDQKFVLDALVQMDLLSLADHSVDSLSGGERRRLELATLLVQDPELFLLDEPTNHLDLHHQIDMLKHFHELAAQQQRCIVMASHELNLALRYCSHVLLLYGNGEWEAGKVDELINTSRLEKLYQHPMQAHATRHGDIYLPVLTQVETSGQVV